MQENATTDRAGPGQDNSRLLIVDDDEPFRLRLARAMERRGFIVETAGSITEGAAVAQRLKPTHAVLDLRLTDGSGLDIVGVLREARLPPPPENPMPADRVRWEHIQRVFEQCGRNVSETARRLKMHRRTLQRILAKHAPRA
jgi:two-component system response regulator RegA